MSPNNTLARTTRTATVLITMICLGTSAAAELEIRRVVPQKIFCKPGEAQNIEVEVANPDNHVPGAKLRVEMRSDLDTATPLTIEDLQVEPGKSFVWRGTWKAEPLLGIEVRAAVLRDGNPVAQKSEYFTCARSVHQVLQLGSGRHWGWQFTGRPYPFENYPEIFAQENHATYGNYLEQFAWGESDFDALTPSHDRWWSGQTGSPHDKGHMTSIMEAMHRHGIEVVTYGKASGGGPVGYERLRRMPDFAGYTDGRFWGSYNSAGLDYLEALGPPRPDEKGMGPDTPEKMEQAGYKDVARFQSFTQGYNWCDIWWSCGDPRVAGVGIGQLVGSAKMFGFDGVRFDGEFSAGRYQRLDGTWNYPENYDSEKANVELVQRMKKECWAAKPGYLFGYNTGTEANWAIEADNVPSAFREKCKDDGYVANEGFAFPGDVPWLDYCLRVRREAEIVRYYGGHYATYGFNRGGENLYNFILEYGLRSHLMANHNGAGAAWLPRSVTRFAKLLWDDSLTTWHAAADTVSVTGDGEVWWKEFAAVGEAPGGGTRYILHLYNPPQAKTTASKDPQLPSKPLNQVKVIWKNLRNLKRACVVDMETMSLSDVQFKDGAFVVGPLPIWKILVVDINATRPAPTYEKPAAAASRVTTPTKEDLQLIPKAPETRSAWTFVQEPEQWGGGEDTASRDADPDALNGAACHSKPGRPTGSMAYTYQYPRIPGTYTATFRLKVADNTSDKPVFRLGSGRSVESPYPGVGGLASGTRTLAGRDFAKPNVYQDFTIEFDFADYGFMSCDVQYLGNIEGWWDRTTLRLQRAWSAEELARHYAKFTAPEGLARTPHEGLRVLAVRGLYNRLYRLQEAAGAIPGAKLTDAYTSYHQQQGTKFLGYALDWKPIWDLDVIVLANVETKGLNYGQVMMLTEWVKAGGGLVILGGNVTLGQDDNMKNAWPLMLPVELNGPWEIRRCSPPAAFAQPPAGSPFKASWKSPPEVIFRHIVKPVAGAQVLMAGAAGEPLWVGKQYGKGRVAVFTGTVLGEALKGQTMFWEDAGWKDILAAAITWSAGE